MFFLKNVTIKHNWTLKQSKLHTLLLNNLIFCNIIPDLNYPNLW
jgi:hypothetical protein